VYCPKSVVATSRAEIEARAKVTDRMRPLKVDGRIVHQVAIPFHWSYGGRDTGDSANDLIPLSGDPNVSIEDTKSFTCDVRAGRRTDEATHKLAGRQAEDLPPTAPNLDHPAETPKVKP
jgi:formate dehydrogenase major subunit